MRKYVSARVAKELFMRPLSLRSASSLRSSPLPSLLPSAAAAAAPNRLVADVKAFAAIIPGRVGWLWMNDLKVRACVISVRGADGRRKKVLRKGDKGTCKVVTERGIVVEKFKGARRMGRFIWGVEGVEGVGIVEELL